MVLIAWPVPRRPRWPPRGNGHGHQAEPLVHDEAEGAVRVDVRAGAFGNVPINGQIKLWTPPADYPVILQRWEMFNIARTLTALAAFTLVITLTVRSTQVRQTDRQPELPAPTVR